MKKRVIFIGVYILTFSLLANLQAIAQPSALQDVKLQMIKDWTRAKTYTIEYLNAMPKERYSYKPVDSISSFAGQMIHLAVVDLFLMYMATDQKPPDFTWYDFSNAGAKTKDSVIYYVSASYDYCINAVKAFDISKWSEKKEVSKQVKTKFELMTEAFEHQTHHRGQTTIYIRLQGIKPPEANLF